MNPEETKEMARKLSEEKQSPLNKFITRLGFHKKENNTLHSNTRDAEQYIEELRKKSNGDDIKLTQLIKDSKKELKRRDKMIKKYEKKMEEMFQNRSEGRVDKKLETELIELMKMI
jgi:predicted  nucleic acid-binding Zn-ribbon protein